MNRISVNTLLSSVIGILAATIVVLLALGAWDSWNRYTTINRITAVVETTGHLFKALHNLRYDRSNTNRDLLADRQLSGVSALVKTAREQENAALKAALVSLATVEFADQKTAHADLTARVNKLLALQDESAAAFVKPKAERRADLAKDYMTETGAMLAALDKLSGQLNQLVKLQDSFIDQMMALKQLAWIMRNASGDASLGVTNALAGLPIPPDAMALYTGHVGKTDGAWAALEDLVAGMSLPAGLKKSIDTVKQEFYSREYIELRTNILKAKIAGTDPGIAMEKWTPFTIAKLALVVNAAESALDTAKDYAATQRSAAIQSLAVQCGLLVIAIIFGGAMMLTVSRRVTKPLAMIQSVMMRLAKGDLTAEVSFAGRKDEIGALAQTTDVFRSSMTEAARLRGEQDEAERRANSQRKAEMQQLANEFEKAVGGIVATVSSAASELESAAGQLTQTADTTQQLSGMVASASEEASANVQSVASAAEEMSASVSEISRQVHESSKIADEAVAQARKTDARILELSNSAGRIGDVVKLITEIAAQTNLLALNAKQPAPAKPERVLRSWHRR
jgi:methyl-accepting chemotaxis protein